MWKLESQYNLYVDDGYEYAQEDAEEIDDLKDRTGGILGTYEDKHELMQILAELKEIIQKEAE